MCLSLQLWYCTILRKENGRQKSIGFCCGAVVTFSPAQINCVIFPALFCFRLGPSFVSLAQPCRSTSSEEPLPCNSVRVYQANHYVAWYPFGSYSLILQYITKQYVFVLHAWGCFDYSNRDSVLVYLSLHHDMKVSMHACKHACQLQDNNLSTMTQQIISSFHAESDVVFTYHFS